MLYFPQTSIELSRERPVAPGTLITAEGAALVAVMTNGEFGVQLSTGAANEQFAGVSINSQTTLLQKPEIQVLTAVSNGASGTAERAMVTLPYAPVGAMRVTPRAGGRALTVESVNGKDVILEASAIGTVLRVQFAFEPTVAQAIGFQGNVLPGGPAGQYMGQVGVITRGDVYTDQFVQDGAWELDTNTHVKLDANGMFAPATAADADRLEGVYIVAKPTMGRAYLGLSVNIA